MTRSPLISMGGRGRVDFLQSHTMAGTYSDNCPSARAVIVDRPAELPFEPCALAVPPGTSDEQDARFLGDRVQAET
ncbi:MAG: hypothetical protein HY720_16910 [Planctomycetes bacterium]|nr:hypothetical protein [Planctomycetota bacterium]